MQSVRGNLHFGLIKTLTNTRGQVPIADGIFLRDNVEVIPIERVQE
ncbi:MAG: hypothetical protein HY360_27285 [Verrucomicrobia bacterium]|nr:hypothetical protein [Verrucomicrobiota bacterium]